ncbi:hypothetical protein [Amycolatopsis pithecellobii]|uniref:Uncharacterized protein n=1 Tax=Amycolatopsis pithecellobii TaxID=664692 RepID=A0A6N7Z0I3_9PSEU|nr:hypothetical protein [Amycolatopsis pithecellobii]MTD57782.1 hypothetical protein [Amycolatopsis pithecellobii]
MNQYIAKKNDEIITGELSRYWTQRGERLGFGSEPIRAYVRARIGDEARLPHEPISDMPELDLGRLRWPLPSPDVLEEDWSDDPTVGCFVHAEQPDQRAVLFADHLAHSRGEARLAVSDQRVAIVYPTKLFGRNDSVFTTFCETDPRQVRVTAGYVGRSVPPPQVIRVGFADGSVLLLRDPMAAARVARY